MIRPAVLLLCVGIIISGCSGEPSAEQKRNNFDLCVINQPDYYPSPDVNKRDPIFPGSGFDGIEYKQFPRLKTLTDKERDCAYHLK
jgi:hypothetical protein